MRTRPARALAAVVAAALGLFGACAKVPPIEGARCGNGGCPAGFRCNEQGVCELERGGPMTDPSGAGGAPGSAPAPGAGADAGPMPTLCPVAPGPAPLRRLTRDEYRNTVRDLVGVDADVSLLPEDPRGPGGFAIQAETQLPSPPLAESVIALAKRVSAEAVTTLDRLVDCGMPAPGASVCGRAFVAEFGPRAYRRPLDREERLVLESALDAGIAAGGLAEGVRRVIEVALSSPQFLYRSEKGSGSLSSWERATRLSYFLWSTMPDHELFARAGEGRLGTSDEVGAQVARMLDDPRAGRTVTAFVRSWLELGLLDGAPKDTQAEPSFTPEVQRTVTSTSEALARRLVWDADEGLPAWFTFGQLLGDRAMASFYGLAKPAGDGLELLAPTGDQKRFGLLTLPAILAARAPDAETNIVARGVFVVQQLLCKDLPRPPAAGFNVKPRPADQSATTRDRFVAHAEDPACAACHREIDPVAFGLENYDGFARWRTHYPQGGQVINPNGYLGDTAFRGPGGLAGLLATRPDVRACVVRQWFRFAFGRDAAPEGLDRCTLAALGEAFERGGLRTRALLQAIATSEAFVPRGPAPQSGP